MKQNILVIGASGNVGKEIVTLLKKDGHEVRTTTSKKATGLNEVHLNLTNGEGLEAAFKNIDRAFFMSPAGFADQFGILSPLIKKAKEHKLKKVVLMTAMGVEHAVGSPFQRAEVELENSGLEYNIIRPNWFMQNFHTFWLHGIQKENKVIVPAGKAKVSFIDSRDISAVAASLLTQDKWNKKAFTLTGSEALTHDDVARGISEVSGKKMTYFDVNPSDFKQGLMSAGLTSEYADLLLVLFDALRAGHAEAISQDVKLILGRNPLSFQNYLKDSKENWS